MSCVACCAHRARRRLLRKPDADRSPSQEVQVRRGARRAAAGVAATTFAYVALLAVPDHVGSSFGTGLTSASARRLRPYGAAVAEQVTSAGQVGAQLLERVSAFAPWPLATLGLIWLARRDQTLYVRLASALLLFGAAGLVVFASVRGLSVRELPLVHGYLSLPAVRASWFVLLGLAVVATTTKAWPRVTVALVAAGEVVGAVSATDPELLAVLLAAVVPVVAWNAAGRLFPRAEKQRHRAAGTVESDADVVVLQQPRTRAPQTHAGPAPTPVPLRRAG
ncbi:hypothetical protein ACWD4G_18040 [Streptomyces sp. NPDC002643]